MPEASRFARFFVVGGLGFVVDAGGVILLSDLLGLAPWLARIPSFLVATVVTYAFHRRWTFGTDPRGGVVRGWLTYITATSLGALLNYGAFALWTASQGETPLMLFVGTAIGSAIGLAFNYTMSSRLIFRRS